MAHVDGGVPNIVVELDELNEYTFGEMVYFFEKACGISGLLMGLIHLINLVLKHIRKICSPFLENQV